MFVRAKAFLQRRADEQTRLAAVTGEPTPSVPAKMLNSAYTADLPVTSAAEPSHFTLAELTPT